MRKTPLPSKHYVDAAGRYLGAFGGLLVEETGENGKVISSREQWPDVPEGATEVLEPPENRHQIWDFQAEVWITDLGPLKEDFVAELNTQAGQARAKYITPIIGQDLTYQAKAEEAQAFIQAGRPTDATAYPLLATEAPRRRMTVSDLADEVLATRQAWIQKAAQIEGARMGGKTALQAAATAEEARTALASAISELEAL